jgi:cytochrome c biogenesis protein CcdA
LDQQQGHTHPHKQKRNITPWVLFTIFIFGPCEPLIPIVMYPSAKENYQQMFILTLIFSLITITTMMTLVAAAHYGFKFIPMKKLEKHYHTLAGGAIFLCGMGMLVLGL